MSRCTTLFTSFCILCIIYVLYCNIVCNVNTSGTTFDCTIIVARLRQMSKINIMVLNIKKQHPLVKSLLSCVLLFFIWSIFVLNRIPNERFSDSTAEYIPHAGLPVLHQHHWCNLLRFGLIASLSSFVWPVVGFSSCSKLFYLN